MISSMMNSVINPKFLDLHEFLLSLPDTFSSLNIERTLRSGRNEVLLLSVNGHKIVIKSFCKFSAINRVVYGTIRRSKAMRAYYNALQLLELGISTPEPIAAIDVRRYGILRRSFYVYAYSEYSDLKQALDSYPEQRIEPLLDALSDFIIHVHDCGVLHNDFNVLNILYAKSDEGYDFQLIDINRMTFHSSISTRQRLANLRRFNCKPATLIYMLERYAKHLNLDCEKVQLHGMGMRFLDTLKHELKCWVKR